MRLDCLIVGQGLAGSLLAWELMQRGSRVVLLDDGAENASQIAAGLINPITGMRLVKAESMAQQLPYARQFYAQLAQQLGQNFWVDKPMLRILSTAQEAEYAAKRLRQAEYQAYLTGLEAPVAYQDYFAAPHGILAQQQTAYLQTRVLLDCLRHYLLSRASYITARFSHQEVQLTPTLQWREYQPHYLICCEGYQGQFNPWFSWLPFAPVQGEILTLQHTQPWLEQMLNFGHWLIPISHQQVRLGATFARDSVQVQPSAAARQELMTSLQRLNPSWATANVLQQHAGCRPCTQDRQPFIGRHPQLPSLLIFNGFGAKGSLQIPWYCRSLAQHLLQGEPLPGESDIQRYYGNYRGGGLAISL